MLFYANALLCMFQAVSEENMRQSALLVRNVCQPKFKISDGKSIFRPIKTHKTFD